MHLETLVSNTKNILAKLAEQPFLSSFYLSGGTALALHLGHRESEDLDFFTPDNFNSSNLQAELERITSLSGLEQDKGNLNCYADDVKLQFLHYPYSLLKQPTIYHQIRLSSIEDIACTKLLTISSRGSKKDFIDLFFILQKHSLPELFNFLPKKYPKTDYNQIHILKSLVYFDDADDQVMPRMHIQVSWKAVKASIVKSVKSFKIT